MASGRWAGRGFCSLVAAIGVLVLTAPATPAATIAVTTEKDGLALDGRCSLREALQAANEDVAFADCPPGAGADTIALAPGSYVLNEGLGPLEVRTPLTIAGAGADATTIFQTRPERVFVVAAVPATIADVSITGGLGTGGGIGNAGQLTILRCKLFGNAAVDGGDGIEVEGTTGDTVGQSGGKGGSGGAIFNSSPGSSLLVIESELTGNRAGDGGDGGVGVGVTGVSGVGAGNGGTGGLGRGGGGGEGGDGGAIAGPGSVTIVRSTLARNRAGDGGEGGVGVGGRGGMGGGSGGGGGNGGDGVGGRGGNGGSGGALAVSGPLTVIDSTIAVNRSGSAGGGGFGDDGFGGGGGPAGEDGSGTGGDGGDGGAGGGIRATATLNVSGSLLTGDVTGNGGAGSTGTDLSGDGGSGGPGGAIAAAGAATVLNSTLVFSATGAGAPGGNNAVRGAPGSGGSGAAVFASAALALRHVTISRDAVGAGGAGIGPAGAGAVRALGPAILANSIVAENRAANCAGPIADGGHDVSFPDPSCPGASADPRLGPLADNGGPTRTLALGPGSAAIDAVPASGAGCPPVDQRGASRPQGAACDAGAFELAVAAPAAPAAAGGQPAPAPAPPRAAADRTAPVILSASLRPAAFAVARHARPERAVTSARRKRRAGARFRYRLSEPARVVFEIERARAGRRVRGRCRRPTPATAGKRRCNRYRPVAGFAAAATAGRNSRRFSGRIGRVALPPGRYRATLTATDPAGNASRPRRLGFRILRR